MGLKLRLVMEVYSPIILMEGSKLFNPKSLQNKQIIINTKYK